MTPSMYGRPYGSSAYGRPYGPPPPRPWSEYPEAMIRGQAFHAATEKASEEVFERFGVATGLTAPGATLEELADALSRAAVPRAENWSWPTRPRYDPPSGAAEPVRAAFCRFLETGEPYHREEF